MITCTPVTGDSELIDQSQVRITSAKLLQRERRLNEKTVKPQARRESGEHQLRTIAQGDPDDGMIEELLKELEELDEPHEFTEDNEAMIDALLQELQLEIALSVKDERIELIAEMERIECVAKYGGAHNVLVVSISEVKGASSSETMIRAEGKSQRLSLDWSF